MKKKIDARYCLFKELVLIKDTFVKRVCHLKMLLLWKIYKKKLRSSDGRDKIKFITATFLTREFQI